MTASELYHEIRRKRSFLCVGLDTDPGKIPPFLLKEKNPVFAFNKAIVDATSDLAIAFKPNLAFYESMGMEGWKQLEMTVDYIRSTDPNLFIIADAKRGDIGNTASRYARTFFIRFDFDAVTLSPYMGRDSILPFLDYPGKWAIILGLTSNSGASDFQLQTLSGGDPLYIEVIRSSSQWGTINNLMYVVGATRPEYFAPVRKMVPEHFLLVPGIGAQGGALEDVITHGKNAMGGLIINNSRGILYAGKGIDFAGQSREAALSIVNEMKKLGSL